MTDRKRKISETQQIKVQARVSKRDVYNAHVNKCPVCDDGTKELCPEGRKLLAALLRG